MVITFVASLSRDVKLPDGRGGEIEQQKTDDFRIKPPTGVFLENRPGLLPRQSVIYFPPDLPPTRRRGIKPARRFAVSDQSLSLSLLFYINKRGFAFIGERGRGVIDARFDRRSIRGTANNVGPFNRAPWKPTPGSITD